MISYLTRRVAQAILVVLMASFLVFGIMHWLPGDPILIYVTSDSYKQYTAEEIEALRAEYGLNRPVVVQYAAWLGGVLTGDLGESITRGTSVREDIARALPNHPVLRADRLHLRPSDRHTDGHRVRDPTRQVVG